MFKNIRAEGNVRWHFRINNSSFIKIKAQVCVEMDVCPEENLI